MNATSVDGSHDLETQSNIYSPSTTLTSIRSILLIVWIFVSTPFHFQSTRMYQRYILHNHHWLPRTIGGGLHRIAGVRTASTLFRGVAVSSFQLVPTKSVSCHQTTPSTTATSSISPRLLSSSPKSSSFAVPTMGTDGDDHHDGTSTNPKNHVSGYEKWVRRLYATNMFHPVKLGLDNMRQLHQLLGHPMDDVSAFAMQFCSNIYLCD
jgi:hypothetical protein